MNVFKIVNRLKVSNKISHKFKADLIDWNKNQENINEKINFHFWKTFETSLINWNVLDIFKNHHKINLSIFDERNIFFSI